MKGIVVNDILAQVFPSRIEAIEALLSGTGGDELRESASRADQAATLFGLADAAQNWRDFAKALEIAAFLTDWERAARNAESDADRFLRAARVQYHDLVADNAVSDFGKALVDCLAVVDGDLRPNDIPALRTALARIQMPVAMIATPDMRARLPFREIEPKPVPQDVAVAFLEFAINGQPAASLHSLSAGQIHDLDLTIRISRWPEEAERLVIGPVSVEPASMWEFPRFEFPKPEGDPPYTFERHGRMVLHGGQGFSARPLEFRYAAEFQPAPSWDQRVVIAGLRTLRLNGTDTSRHAITGYSEIDARIIELREKLRLEPLVAENDIRDLLLLLGPIGNLMGQAVQDKRYPDPIDEATFQKDVLAFLRANSSIGQELELQPQIAGGRTDLSFRGIRLELKSEQTRRLLPDDCRQFAEQAATYAVGSGRRIAVLVVLDSSRKYRMPFPIADGLFMIPVNTGASPIFVVTSLLQGSFSRPSDLSR